MSTSTDTILAYQAENYVEARALAAYLDEAGIAVRVLGESLQGAYGRIGALNDAQVWVASADREAAEPLIAAWRDEQQARELESGQRRESSSRTPTAFRFSMMAVLIVMTIVAVGAGSYAVGEEAFNLFGVILQVALFLSIPIIFYYRRYSSRAK